MMKSRSLITILSFGLAYSSVIELSCEQIRALVNGHNDHRMQLANGTVEGQPAASEMKSVVWDENLAKKAAGWAGHEEYKHNKDKTLEPGKGQCGENLYEGDAMGSDYIPNIEEAINSWFEEHKNYLYSTSERINADTPIGHYTQLVWSNSSRVGCGMSSYAVDGNKKILIVCNYYPAGNFPHTKPYKSGTPSEQLVCEDDCSKPYGEDCSVDYGLSNINVTVPDTTAKTETTKPSAADVTIPSFTLLCISFVFICAQLL